MSAATTQLQEASLSDLARIVRADWRNVYYAARPYLEAMLQLDSVDDRYGPGREAGTDIVLRFIGNSRGWRGDTARAVKRELRRRVGL